MNRRWAALLTLVLVACNYPAASAPTPFANPTETATQAETASEAVAATSTLSAVLPHVRPVYQIDATLDYAAHYLAVSQEITYTNNSRIALDEIPILVPAEGIGALFDLQSYSTNVNSEWAIGSGLLTISLESALQPGQQITINLSYSLTLPQRASTLGWTERQTNFVDWYPFIPPYVEGSGWLINEPTTQGEYLAYESADFYVNIYTQNTPALFLIAAPAPEVSEGAARSYTLLNARRFTWTASGNFRTASMPAGERDIPVTIYFYEEERDAAEAALQTVAQAVEIYEESYGPYPYETLAVIECAFPDGMESDGLFYLDMEYFRKYSYDARNLLTTLMAHETAHNWWYGAVGNDPAHEAWLDEALATYSELLYYERAHPADVEWWWEFRVDQWQPAGWVNSSAYELPTFRPYVNAVYLRGVQFLHAARAAIGDEAFLVFLRNYYAQGAGNIMTTAEFLDLLRGSATVDLDAVISEYFR